MKNCKQAILPLPFESSCFQRMNFYVYCRKASVSSRHTHYLGKLDMSVGSGRIVTMEPEGSNRWTEKDHLEGEVLIEVEPISYTLKDIDFNTQRTKVSR